MARVPSLKAWVDSYFGDQHVSPAIRKEVRTALTYAGFKEGVPKDRNTFAMKVAHHVVNGTTQKVEASARVAAVVNGDSACPRCGSAMVDAQLANGVESRYCSNPKCRVTAYIE